VGAGVMGRGVAQRMMEHDYSVFLVDIREDILKDAIKSIQRNLLIHNMFKAKSNVQEMMARLTTSTDCGVLVSVDYVIENVSEDVEVKRKVYQELESVCIDECVYMVNTSCIPITYIASFTKRADRVVGVHFMNPVPMIHFSEVIRSEFTSEETIEKINVFLQNVGISIEVVNDSPGFVSNRLSHLFMNEAAFLVYEGVATPVQIDTIFKQAYGHKMGPLQTADLIGIDTVLDSLKVLYDQYEDSKFRACPLLKKMVYAGKLGQKSGVGFYEY
jgi:3-hydroxybutyryl-CoA dehydrogenase